MTEVVPSSMGSPAVKLKQHWVDRVAHILIALIALFLVVFLAAPLLAILSQARPPCCRPFRSFTGLAIREFSSSGCRALALTRYMERRVSCLRSALRCFPTR